MTDRQLSLLGVSFLNLRMAEALDLIRGTIGEGAQKTVYFINADCLNQAVENDNYATVLRQGDLVFPDGSGVRLGCKLLGDQVLDNVNGTDMLPLLCELAREVDARLYFLGAKPGIAARARDKLQARYPGLRIVGEHHGYFQRNGAEETALIDTINSSGAAILLVAFGVPAQEYWIQRHRHQLSATVLMGVGGLFDFYSDTIPRAPRWLRRWGLEWTYRLYQEPRRLFRRYIIGNPLFVWRVLRWRWGNGSGKR